MKQFVVRAYDGEGMLDKRMEIRPRHLEGMEQIREHVICAGGLLDEAGRMKGSMLVMEFENRQQLDEYLASELLKLPETIIPLCAIVIGYPAEQPQPKDKWLPENVSYNEYK